MCVWQMRNGDIFLPSVFSMVAITAEKRNVIRAFFYFLTYLTMLWIDFCGCWFHCSTNDRLQKKLVFQWKIANNNRFNFCGNEDDYLHYFITCSFLKTCWEEIYNLFKRNNLNITLRFAFYNFIVTIVWLLSIANINTSDRFVPVCHARTQLQYSFNMLPQAIRVQTAQAAPWVL